MNITFSPTYIPYVVSSHTLRTKSSRASEPYVLSFMSRQRRSYLAQLRNGILPLRLEVGRWINKAVEERLCLICNNGTVEDEEHFVFHYNFYFSERKEFYNYMKNNIPNFNNLSIEQKLRPPLLLTYVL